MRDTGITRKIDGLGRIILPKEVRSQLNIREHDALSIFVDGEAIVLFKPVPSCIFCGVEGGLTAFEERWLCGSCLGRLAALGRPALCG